ncbi:hypothetical protein ACTFIR_005168 [Dictyostelium discoideum]
MTKLKVGHVAPDFEAKNYLGQTVTLKEFKEKSQPIVLYFYPKDNSPVCTKESCEFRDKYQKFIEAGAEVIGVSSDGEDSHKSFVSKYSLPFTLLTDKHSKLAKLYGVNGILLPGRKTFIIDKHGIIAGIHDGLLSSTSHIDESLKIIEKLKLQI